ncbi:MAG: hypothetical protein ACLS3M_07100 [Collinsella sp.]
MICPHCLKTIEDGASFCPYCNAYVGPGDGPEHTEFVFCEGCGARLSHMIVRAPNADAPLRILRRTRSHPTWQRAARRFPRLTQSRSIPRCRMRPPRRGAFDAADPNETCVLPAFDKDSVSQGRYSHARFLHDDAQTQGASRRGRLSQLASYPQAAHRHRGPYVVAAVLLVRDGRSHGCHAGYDQFGQAAQTTFPTRQKGEATEDDTKQDDAAEVVQEETVLTDDQLYTRLDGLYQTIVSYGDEDQIGEVIDSFNNGYLRTPLSTRQELSQSAYALRDQIKKTQMV